MNAGGGGPTIQSIKGEKHYLPKEGDLVVRQEGIWGLWAPQLFYKEHLRKCPAQWLLVSTTQDPQGLMFGQILFIKQTAFTVMLHSFS